MEGNTRLRKRNKEKGFYYRQEEQQLQDYANINIKQEWFDNI